MPNARPTHLTRERSGFSQLTLACCHSHSDSWCIVAYHSGSYEWFAWIWPDFGVTYHCWNGMKWDEMGMGSNLRIKIVGCLILDLNLWYSRSLILTHPTLQVFFQKKNVESDVIFPKPSPKSRNMKVSWNGATPLSSIFNWDFPQNKPSIYFGVPIYFSPMETGNPPHWAGPWYAPWCIAHLLPGWREPFDLAGSRLR